MLSASRYGSSKVNLKVILNDFFCGNFAGGISGHGVGESLGASSTASPLDTEREPFKFR